MKQKPLSVLMVHPHDLWYDPWTIRILALARELQARGHRITLCHLPRKEKPTSPPIRYPEPNDPPVYDLKPRQIHFISNFKLLYKLAKDCDVIHLQKCFAATALPVLWVSRMLNKPLHYDWDDNETGLSKKVEKRLFSRLQLAMYERMLPHFAHTITYASKWIQDRAVQWGYPAERTFHLPVGADLERFHPNVPKASALLHKWGIQEDLPVVLYIGQMEGAAHAYLLIQAAEMVCQKNPNAQFLLVGGGEQLEDMRKLARCSSVKQNIWLPGYVEQKHIPSILAAADICVACFEDDETTRAKSPLKIAEYLACAKPVVGSDVGEVKMMLGDSGIAVQAGSTHALTEGILEYLSNHQKQKEDGEKARNRAVRLFNWSSGAKTLLKAYLT